MKRPRQQRAEATRDRILDTAEGLFDERGYDKSSMNALAERAEISIGGLYEWFKNKEEVLTAVAERHVSHATAAIVGRLAENSDLDIDQQIRIVLEAGLALHRANPTLHRFLYSEAPRPPALRRRLKAFDDLLEQMLSQHLQGCGVKKKDADLDAALVARAGQALLHEFVLDNHLPYSYSYRLNTLNELLSQLVSASGKAART
ncbi:MAG: TetR/AcrR family transcriptional regulator [Pseudomonadota bacterium]